MVCSPCCKRRRSSPVFAKPNPWPKRFGFILVAAVLTFIVWSWRCFVKLSGIGNREGAMSEMFRLAAFHLLLGPLLVSYLRCVFTDASIGCKEDSKDFVLMSSQSAMEDMSKWDIARCEAFLDSITIRAERLGLRDLDEDGSPRICWTCNMMKPDRCHHCSICQKCVLKFDHHCPWINNCVGFKNHKFFMCFLFWSILELSFVCYFEIDAAMACVERHKGWLESCNIEVMYHFVLSASLLVTCAIMFTLHAYLLSSGLTTIELLQSLFGRGDASRRASVPLKRRSNVLWNLKATLGEDVSSWLIPTMPRMRNDGIKWGVELEEMEAGLVASSSRHTDSDCDDHDPGQDRGGEGVLSEEPEQERLLFDMHVRLNRIEATVTSTSGPTTGPTG